MDNKNIDTMGNKNIVNMDYKISVTTKNTNIITLNIKHYHGQDGHED